MIPYKVISRIAELKNQWIALIGERVLDEYGQSIDYWRVERADSVIVIPFIGEKIIIPKLYYRHGIGDVTYDFPGGRIDGENTPIATAFMVLERELGVQRDAIVSIEPLNQKGWFVDSSFSTQKVYAFEAILSDNAPLIQKMVACKELIGKDEISNIFEKLHCLQCRHALLEWLLIKNYPDSALMNRFCPGVGNKD